MGRMRMFAAAVPPPEVVGDLGGFLLPRRAVANSGWRWTDPAQWHLTLAFLAVVPDRALGDLLERLARAAARRATIRLRIVGGGAFPQVAGARVLYARPVAEDPRGAEELRRLAAGCRAAASKAGIAVEGARFRPHLTLARRGRPIEATRWLRILDTYESESWDLAEIVLVRSYLGEGPRGRPRYEVVARFPLTGRRDAATASSS